ncbi:MAG: stage V sporulation protein B [Firmicutes bacterium]|nr:stage V sporulation protein B [Bacillota bacterium]
MVKQSFLYGAAVLLAASLFNRVLGFTYQVMMVRLIGPEGIGLFNMIYPIYMLLLVLATAGIPVALAKLVAEEAAVNNLRGAYRIFYLCFIMLGLSSVMVTVSCLLAAPYLTGFVFPNPKVYWSFLALLPGLVIVSLCSAFRGFFQGLQQMSPVAATQSLEQLIRVFCGYGIAWSLLPLGVEYAAAGASLGVVIGEFTGFLAILVIYARARPLPGRRPAGRPGPVSLILPRVANLAFPVTLTRLATTFLVSSYAVIIPRRLQASGADLAAATATFGKYVGIAESLLFLPGIVTVSLANALIPAIADVMAAGNIPLARSRVDDALRITCIAGIVSAVFFLVLAEDLCGTIFGYPEVGEILRILALGSPFLYLQQTTTGILNGLGRAVLPFRNLAVAAAVEIAAMYYLTGLPQLGIRGTAAAEAGGFAIMALLNLADVRRLVGHKMELKTLVVKPLLAAGGTVIPMLAVRHGLKNFFQPEFLALAGALAAGVLCYGLLLVAVGAVDRRDIRRLVDALKNRA